MPVSYSFPETDQKEMRRTGKPVCRIFAFEKKKNGHIYKEQRLENVKKEETQFVLYQMCPDSN